MRIAKDCLIVLIIGLGVLGFGLFAFSCGGGSDRAHEEACQDSADDLCAPCLSGPLTGSIVGRAVSAKDGSPVAGVYAMIAVPGKGTVRSDAATDSNGGFAITNVPVLGGTADARYSVILNPYVANAYTGNTAHVSLNINFLEDNGYIKVIGTQCPQILKDIIVDVGEVFLYPTAGAVIGKVQNASEHPIADAPVSVFVADTQSPDLIIPLLATTTGADGTFVLSNVPQGTPGCDIVDHGDCRESLELGITLEGFFPLLEVITVPYVGILDMGMLILQTACGGCN